MELQALVLTRTRDMAANVAVSRFLSYRRKYPPSTSWPGDNCHGEDIVEYMVAPSDENSGWIYGSQGRVDSPPPPSYGGLEATAKSSLSNEA